MMKIINRFFLITGTIVMMYIMSVTGKSLKTPDTPLGILHLELAYTGNKTNVIMEAWSYTGPIENNNINQAIKNTWLDFIFIFFYSLLLFYCCKIITENFSGFFYKAGKVMAFASLNAGLLDILENAGMLLSLNGYISNSVSLFTATFSVLKWTLVLCVMLYIVIAAPFFIYKKLKKG